ncbi:phosphatase [Betaproteobacteria bacterium]|nr:phosphatase [Betaproteobacteria bacterium]
MPASAPAHVLFDLDGTLIDSAPAILASYRAAFADCGIEPACAIDQRLIGPPLNETLRLLMGRDDEALFERLAQAFKQRYDTTGYRQTVAYAGVDALLAQLRADGRKLHIATNKRLHPTRLILEQFGWDDHFASVYALDMVTPRLADKATMLGRQLVEQGVARGAAIYIGDRAEDGVAATANGLAFIAATWGYDSGAVTLNPAWIAADTPSTLLRLLGASCPD